MSSLAEPTSAGRTPRPAIAFDVFALLATIRRNLVPIALSAGLVGVAALGAATLKTPQYRAAAQVLVNPQSLQIVGRDILSVAGSPSIDGANLDSQPVVMTSTTLLGTVVDRLDLAKDPALAAGLGGSPPEAVRADVVERLRKAVTVERVGQSLVYTVTVAHRDARTAAAIANAVAEIYLQQSDDSRTATAADATQALVAQTTTLRNQLDAAERAVEEFRARNGLVSTGPDGLVIDQQIADLYARIGGAQAAVAQLDARLSQIRAGAEGATAEAAASGTLATLRAQHARLVQEEARLARTLGPLHPTLVEAASQRQAVAGLIQQELDRIRAQIRTERDRAVANLANLQAQADTLASSQSTSNEAMIRLRTLEGEAAAIRAVYQASTERIKELEQQRTLPANVSRVISRAEPPARTDAPNKAIVLAAGLLFGAVLGVAAAFGSELVGYRLPLSAAPVAARGGQGRPARAPSSDAAGPVIGRLPGARGLSALLRRGRGQPGEPAPEAVAAFTRRLGPARPSTVLVAPTDRRIDTGRAVAALARGLAHAGEPVLVCRPAAPGRSAPARPGRREAIEFEIERFDPPGRGRRASAGPIVLIDPGRLAEAPDLGRLGDPDTLLVLARGQADDRQVAALKSRVGRLWNRRLGTLMAG